MVEPPISTADEKQPSSTTNTTTTAESGRYNEKNEKDFAYASNKDAIHASPAASAFDLDLEAGGGRPTTPPNTTQNSTLHVLNTNTSGTFHSNASSPAAIGYPTRRRTGDEEMGEVSGRGRTRRRAARRANNTHAVPGAPPTARRAQSLPTRAPMTTGSQTGVAQQPLTKKLNTLLFQPEHKLAPVPNWTQSAVNTVKHSWLNIMLIFVPISWGMVSSSTLVSSFRATPDTSCPLSSPALRWRDGHIDIRLLLPRCEYLFPLHQGPYSPLHII